MTSVDHQNLKFLKIWRTYKKDFKTSTQEDP